jgi:SAM-dependent methyltransferase
MSMFARQFGRPRGLLGWLVGRAMARGNGSFNRWFVQEVKELSGDARRIVELGPGPGVGLQEVLRTFPEARVWGVDLSPEMLSQSLKRNRDMVTSGRLVLLQGDVASLEELAPVDLVLAAHVLYFWHEPAAQLSQLRRTLSSGGHIALGYQVRANMPKISQKNFPKEGHLLYDTDDELARLLESAGFKSPTFVVKGPKDAPEGRLALAQA